MKSITLISNLVLLALLATPVGADEQGPQAPQAPPGAAYGPAPGTPMHGVEPPPGPGHWEQAPEGWVWVPENYEEYLYVPPTYAAPYGYVYAPGYYYWTGRRWVWRAVRWAVRDHYRDRYWGHVRPYAPYYGYRAAPRYYGYGTRYGTPGRNYLRYDYWRDNRPLRDR
jgi:hypothetical protein